MSALIAGAAPVKGTNVGLHAKIELSSRQEEMRDRGDAGVGVVQLLGIRLNIGDEFFQGPSAENFPFADMTTGCVTSKPTGSKSRSGR